jgi:hypothetical protein
MRELLDVATQYTTDKKAVQAISGKAKAISHLSGCNGGDDHLILATSQQKEQGPKAPWGGDGGRDQPHHQT